MSEIFDIVSTKLISMLCSDQLRAGAQGYLGSQTGGNFEQMAENSIQFIFAGHTIAGIASYDPDCIRCSALPDVNGGHAKPGS